MAIWCHLITCMRLTALIRRQGEDEGHSWTMCKALVTGLDLAAAVLPGCVD